MAKLVIQARIDIKTFAMIASYLHKRGLNTLTRSAVVGTVFESVGEKLIQSGMAKPQTAHEAIQVLSALGLGGVLGGRNEQPVFRALREDALLTLDEAEVGEDERERIGKLMEESEKEPI